MFPIHYVNTTLPNAHTPGSITTKIASTEKAVLRKAVETPLPEKNANPQTPSKNRPREALEHEIELLRAKLSKKKTKRSPPLARLKDFACHDYDAELEHWKQNKTENKKAVRPAGIRIKAFLKRSFVTNARINEFKAFGTILNGASNQRSMTTICEELNMTPNVMHFLERLKHEHAQACALREQLEDAAINFETAYDEFCHAVKDIE